MKQSAGKILAVSFVKSFLIVLIMYGVSFLGYQAVMHYWSAQGVETAEIFEEQPKAVSITVASIDDVSKNLIYCINEETGEISKILLEIFHCENKKLYYITIPVRTQFTMSDTLYQRLILVHPAIPQMIKLSTITKYFDQDSVFDYGVLVMEDLLDIKINYYTAIKQRDYETMFTTEEISPQKTVSVEVSSEKEVVEGVTIRKVPKEVFSKDYIDYLKTLQTAEELSKYIEGIYPSVQSNLSLYGKMNYFESYCNTPRGNIFFELICGTDKNSAYIIDTALAAKQLKECMALTEK